MEGYSCDFCGKFKETGEEPFAIIRAGEWNTWIRSPAEGSKRMGFYMDACESCWDNKLKEPILGKKATA